LIRSPYNTLNTCLTYKTDFM